jgi:hypothetical protein
VDDAGQLTEEAVDDARQLAEGAVDDADNSLGRLAVDAALPLSLLPDRAPVLHVLVLSDRPQPTTAAIDRIFSLWRLGISDGACFDFDRSMFELVAWYSFFFWQGSFHTFFFGLVLLFLARVFHTPSDPYYSSLIRMYLPLKCV